MDVIKSKLIFDFKFVIREPKTYIATITVYREKNKYLRIRPIISNKF